VHRVLKSFECLGVADRAQDSTLVLPIRPGALAESELMDEDLEAVSGGVLTPTRGAENLRYMKITDPVGGFGKLAAITRTMPGFRNR
jgi:hypothetical protein